MFKLRHFVLTFLRQQEGPTAVEYAVMLALIIVVCIAAIQNIGNQVDETAEVVTSALKTGT
jgi:pilus assembly protein Flp/PilA